MKYRSGIINTTHLIFIMLIVNISYLGASASIEIDIDLTKTDTNYILTIKSTINNENDSVNIPLVVDILYQNNTVWFSTVEITDDKSSISIEINLPSYLEGQYIKIQVIGPSFENYLSNSRVVSIPIHPSNIEISNSDNTDISNSDNTDISNSDNTDISNSDNTDISNSDNTDISNSDIVNNSILPKIFIILLFFTFLLIILIYIYFRSDNKININIDVNFNYMKIKTKDKLIKLKGLYNLINIIIIIPKFILQRIFSFIILIKILYIDYQNEKAIIKKNGYKNLIDYRKGKSEGYINGDNFYEAITTGFRDRDTYQKAKNLGYPDMKSYQLGIQGNFTNYKHFQKATKLGFENVKEFNLAIKLKIPNYDEFMKSYQEIVNKNFPSYPIYKNAITLGCYDFHEFKALQGGYKNIKDYRRAVTLGFNRSNDYYFATKNGFNNYFDFKKARRYGIEKYHIYKEIYPIIEKYKYPSYKSYKEHHENLSFGNFESYPAFKLAKSIGFNNKNDYDDATKKGFKNFDDYSIAMDNGFKNFKDFIDAQKLGLLTNKDYIQYIKNQKKSKREYDKLKKFLLSLEEDIELEIPFIANKLKISQKTVKTLTETLINENLNLGIQIIDNIVIKSFNISDIGIITKTNLTYPIGVCPYCQAKEKYSVFYTALRKKNQCPSCKRTIDSNNLIKMNNKSITKKYLKSEKGIISKKKLIGIIAEHRNCGAKDFKKILLETLKLKNCPKCNKKVINMKNEIEIYEIIS